MVDQSKIGPFVIIFTQLDVSASSIVAVPLVHTGLLLFSALVNAVDDHNRSHND